LKDSLRKILIADFIEIRYLDYDWSLNAPPSTSRLATATASGRPKSSLNTDHFRQIYRSVPLRRSSPLTDAFKHITN